MSISTSFGFYLDPVLTTPAICPVGCLFTVQGGGVAVGFAIDINSLDALALQQDVQVWFGSPADASNSVRDAVNPGVTSIGVSGINYTALGANPITRLSLALSQSGLDSATPGAPLGIGATVAGGVGNAVSFWVRYKVLSSDPEFGCAEIQYTNLILLTQDLVLTDP